MVWFYYRTSAGEGRQRSVGFDFNINDGRLEVDRMKFDGSGQAY